MIQAVAPDKKLRTPFPRLTYAEAMARYASDKPDLRFGLETTEVSDLAAETGFRVFHSVIQSGGIVKGLAAPGLAHYTTSQVRALEEVARAAGAGGLCHIRYRGAAPISELPEDAILQSAGLRMPAAWHARLAQRMGAGPGDLTLLMAGPPARVNTWLSAMRTHLAETLELADADELAFAFITDFPLFEWNEDAQRWEFFPSPVHRPGRPAKRVCWTAAIWAAFVPKPTTWFATGRNWPAAASASTGGSCKSASSASSAMTGDEVGRRFHQILEAFEYGAPPHGGIAPGIDRLAAILAGAASIREVIAFPKTQSGADLLFDAPSEVAPHQLRDLSLQISE